MISTFRITDNAQRNISRGIFRLTNMEIAVFITFPYIFATQPDVIIDLQIV